MSITVSHIVSHFSSLKQYLQIDQNMGRIKKLKTFIKKRRETQQLHLKSTKNIIRQKKNDSNILLQKLRDEVNHKIKLEELYSYFQTSLQNGLTSEKATQRLKTQGRNEIPEKPQPHWTLQFFKQVSDPFSLWMWVLMVLNFILFGFIPSDLNSLMLAWILIVTLFSGGAVAYSFNKQTSNIIKAFQDFIPKYSTVLRDGQWKTILSQKLVRGDIIKILPGEKIPADVRIVQCHGMKINKSTFTGQSELVKVTVECTNPDNPLQSNNMAFSGCINEEGEGNAIVINTGVSTLISLIADDVLNVEEKTSSLEYEVEHYVKRVTLFAFFVGTLTFSIGMGNGFHPVIAAMIAIGVIIASVPGVLNLILRVMLTISVKRMSQKKIIAKNLYALQVLGSATCLCLDKTGTITINKMSVSKIWFDQKILQANSAKLKQFSINESNEKYKTCFQLIKCAILASVAKFDKAPPRQSLNQIYTLKYLPFEKREEMQNDFEKQWQQNLQKKQISQIPVIGSSTQAALIRYCQSITDVESLRKMFPIAKNKQGNDISLPFNSTRKYSMSLHRMNAQNSAYCAYAKGAPQIIWEMCSHMMINGNFVRKNEKMNENFKQTLYQLTKSGQRVLGFAKYHLPIHEYRQSTQFIAFNNTLKKMPLIFLGIMSLSDPPREGIQQTILKLKIAGIKIIMLTGDQVSTAINIARECNIIRQQKTANQIAKQQDISIQRAMLKTRAIVVEGQQFLYMKSQDNQIADNQQKKSFYRTLEMDEIVFARTNPAQKLMIVQQLQKMGHIVAVTGDGVNDSPAVRMSDCGISMGSGSDTTRDAATIVLIDDNLNNLTIAVEEGRKMYDNLKKSIVYVMTSQISQFVPFLFLITFRIPIPIFTLLIDSAADFIPSIAYAYEQSQMGIMTRPPKDKNQRLVTFKLVAHASGWNGFAGFFSCFCCYWICMKDFGFHLDYLWTKSNIHILVPNKSDSYNPTSPTFGNSNLQGIKTCAQFYGKSQGLDWINTARPWADLRMSVLTCDQSSGVAVFRQNMVFDECRVQQISMVSLAPICYTTQATKYSQTAYMFGNVINQLFVAIMSKTRRQSVFKHGLRNSGIFIGYSAQYLLGIALAQTWLLTTLIGTRDVLYFHCGLPAIPLGILQFTIDELRKYLIRNLPRDNMGDPTRKYEECKPNWFERNTLW